MWIQPAREVAATVLILLILVGSAWSVFSDWATTTRLERSAQARFIDRMHHWLQPVPAIVGRAGRIRYVESAAGDRIDRRPVAAYVLAPIGVNANLESRWALTHRPDAGPPHDDELWQVRVRLGDDLVLLERVEP